MINNKLKNNKKKVLIPILLLAAIILCLVVYFSNRQSKDNKVSPVPLKAGSVNYDPPTDQEKKDAEDHKDDLAKQYENSQVQNSGKKTVTPVITSSSSQSSTPITINTYVPGIVEDSGTCNLIFISGSKTISKTVNAFANVSNTNCEPVLIQKSEFNGISKWTLSVSYTSSSAEGISAKQDMEIK